MRLRLALALLLCVWLRPAASACGDDERQSVGPARAEALLREALKQASVETLSEAELIQTLAAARAAAAGRHARALERTLALAQRLAEAAPPPEADQWPGDVGLLLLLARLFPVPTPESWLPALEQGLGSSPMHDVARVELMAKAPRREARAILRRGLRDSLEGEGSIERQCALLHALRWVDDLEGAPLLHRLQSSADPPLRHFAGMAYRVVLSRAARAEHWTALAQLLEAAAGHQPPGFSMRLDGAARALRSDGPLPDLMTTLDELIEATGGHDDTGWQILHGEALLGRAAAGLFSGEPFETVRSFLRRAAAPDRPLLDREDDLRVVVLRARLLEAFLGETAGVDSGPLFREILEQAPIDDDTNLLDRAWFGLFGPDPLVDPLRRRGHSTAVRRAHDHLVRAVEETTEQNGYGILQRRPDQDERSVSWSFLEAGRLRLEDGGDARAAAEFARERVEPLESLSLWNNLELVVHVRLLEARAQLHLRDAAAAHRTLDSAYSMAEGLRTGYQREMVRGTDREELPPLPAEALFRGDTPVYRDLLARVLLMQATVRATLEGDAAGAARDLYHAGENMDWSVDRWMAVALDQARRGLPGLARRSLACVEPLPDQLYDQACVAALLGDRDRAVALLRDHLEHRTYTAAGRAREIEYMAADPDLAAVHDHPDFPRP